MIVKNYYKMATKEVEYHLDRIREWLFESSHDDQRVPKVLLALHVAINALELKRDDFVQTIIDTLT